MSGGSRPGSSARYPAGSLGELDPSTASGFAHASDDGVPVVVDAGAIPLVDLGPRAVLTPHAGELAAVLDVPREEIERDPAAAAVRAAAQTGSVVLLKGSATHVATPDGAVRLVASSATPWLAAAGAGDVLGGVLGALVAARMARPRPPGRRCPRPTSRTSPRPRRSCTASPRGARRTAARSP